MGALDNGNLAIVAVMVVAAISAFSVRRSGWDFNSTKVFGLVTISLIALAALLTVNNNRDLLSAMFTLLGGVATHLAQRQNHQPAKDAEEISVTSKNPSSK